MGNSQGNSWSGSTDPAVESGTATFRVGGSVIVLELRSFTDFHVICGLLEVSRLLGVSQARASVGEAVRRALEEAGCRSEST